MFRPQLACRPTTNGLFVQATRHPMFGGKVTTREIEGITISDLADFLSGKVMVQDLPISVRDREFLLTGFTDEEQMAVFDEEG